MAATVRRVGVSRDLERRLLIEVRRTIVFG
jgi:hypothetical protein